MSSCDEEPTAATDDPAAELADDDAPAAQADDDGVHEANDDAPPSPFTAAVEGYRLSIGLVVALVALGVAVWAVLTLAQPTVPGFFGIVQAYAFPLMCTFIAVMGLAWGLRLRQVWRDAAAYAAIATYLAYLLIGWVYEKFVA